MTTSWTKIRLGDVITLQRGFDLPERDRVAGGVPIVSSSGISGYHSEAKVSAPGVVTGRYGTLGEVFYVDVDFWPLNTTLWVKDFKGNCPRFISYLLRTLNLGTQNAAGAVPGLNRNALHLLPVQVPPRSIQERIASILSAYEDLIESNARRIRILEEVAQLIYREWFVNFRFPGHDRVRMTQSEMGVVPAGWCQPYPNYVDYLEGPGLRKWEFRDTGIPFLNVRNLIDHDIETGKSHCVDAEIGSGKYRHFLLAEDDHVVSSSGTLGRIATVRKRHLPVMLNTGIIRMRAKTEAFGKWQIKHFLQSEYFQKQIRALAMGVAQIHFGPSHLKQMKVVVPPPEIGRAYEALVDPVEELMCNFVEQNRNLRAAGDLLLPKLVSGEINLERFESEAIALGV